MKNKEKNLVIIESPAKARSLEGYLGDGFEIIASNGHVRDLPRHYLGVDVDNCFRPTYTILPEQRKIVAELKKKASKYSRIYLAADPDREGEAICWHLSEILQKDGTQFRRLRFNAITKESVLGALKKHSAIDMELVNAQQARRVMDRLVGYKISSYLQKLMGKGKSAGRVQTVALRILQEREDEINIFLPVEYWQFTGNFSQDGRKFTAMLSSIDGSKVEKPGNAPHNEKEAGEITRRIGEFEAEWSITGLNKKKRSVKPPPPFITSTLQQAASNRFSFSPSRTMSLAQKLYEGIAMEKGDRRGLITYMRTDSVRISPDSIASCRTFIKETYGSEILSASPRRYRSSKGSQDAHEAIRPVDVSETPSKLKGILSSSMHSLYTLIWNRFVATQMDNAAVEKTTAVVSAGGFAFTCTGEHLLKPGFSLIDREFLRLEKELPDLHKGEVAFDSMESQQKFTSPPPRYSEARLVAEMKKLGIGRPSTYVSTIATLKARQYVQSEGRMLKPTELGEATVRLLIRMFPHIFETGFTASMENLLDSIASGDETYCEVLEKLNTPLNASLEMAMRNMDSVKAQLQEETGENCPECGAPVVVRWGRYGKFKACSAFPGCKYSKPLDEDETTYFQERTCPLCEGRLQLKTGRFGRYLRCENYPKCKHTEPVPTGIPCPTTDCSGELVEKRSRKGRIFYSCSRYPSCSYAMWNKPVDRICPRCGFPILEEKKKGLWCPGCKKKMTD